jgi:hypothetical protein
MKFREEEPWPLRPTLFKKPFTAERAEHAEVAKNLHLSATSAFSAVERLL